MIKRIVLQPIGYVKHTYSDDEVKNAYEGVDGYIEILPQYVEGLVGLEGFSHIIVIAYLHKVSTRQRKVLKVKPKRLQKLGVPLEDIPLVGVFTVDSPHRPNPIALSIVKLKKIKNNVLEVEGLDLFNNTPVLDIRAYTPARCISDLTLPQWYQQLMSKVRLNEKDK